MSQPQTKAEELLPAFLLWSLCEHPCPNCCPLTLPGAERLLWELYSHWKGTFTHKPNTASVSSCLISNIIASACYFSGKKPLGFPLLLKHWSSTTELKPLLIRWQYIHSISSLSTAMGMQTDSGEIGRTHCLLPFQEKKKIYILSLDSELLGHTLLLF